MSQLTYQLPVGEATEREAMPFEIDDFAQCVGDCSQGRRPCQREDHCQPAEAATDVGADYEPTDADRRARTAFWRFYVGALVVAAIGAALWPH